MIFLLDVNALLAMQYEAHVHHARVLTWASRIAAEYGQEQTVFATCPITELGFVRVGSGKAAYAESLDAARADLEIVRALHDMAFIPDDRSAHHLPAWVRKSTQTTDGYLLELAESHGGRLATLDRFIPGALLIPDENAQPLGVREESVTPEWMPHLLSGASDPNAPFGLSTR